MGVMAEGRGVKLYEICPGDRAGTQHFAPHSFEIPGGEIMGARGPLPKLQVVDGTFQPPANSPKAKPVLPNAPWLTKKPNGSGSSSRTFYRAGLLTELDTNTLAMYCETWARFERCQGYGPRVIPIYRAMGS